MSAISFSPNGQLLASASMNGTIKVWDTPTGACRGTFQEGNGRVHGLALTHSGQILATGYLCGTIMLWDLDTGDP